MVWDKLAKKYDNLWVQNYSLAPTRKAVLINIEKLDNINKLLDIGCGTGQLLQEIYINNKNIKLYGLDKSEQMIAQAKSKKSGATLFCADISEDNILESLGGDFDLVVCCHSFPYYKNKPDVINKIYNLLNDRGYVIFAQASINSFYDKVAMSIVEKTAEKADYLSRKDFIALTEKKFEIKEEFQIQEKWFMPSICGFVLKKV
ncbi:MAG: class I SAM-dependent DNA methyltransferase [Mobilitalea sp.]